MDKRFLEDCLAKDMSLDAIGKEVGKHPSTVSYWLKKHGLNALGSAKHAPKGKIDPARIEELTAGGSSIREIAKELGAGYSTIRYWLNRLGLETRRTARLRESESARALDAPEAYLRCPTHGRSLFFLRRDGGGYRCSKCSSDAVTKRRRRVKRQLVEEAGGQCRLCGFSQHPTALHFHHVDPTTKEFHLGFGGESRSLERMRAEARKCVLLCANCHAMVEAGVTKTPTSDR